MLQKFSSTFNFVFGCSQMDFYQEIRKQEALERIASKQGRSLSNDSLPITPIPVPAPKPVKSNPQRFPEGHWQNCEFCGEAYRVRPSHGQRRRACAKPECKAQARSQRRRRIEPKQCEYSHCNNTLSPRSKQKRFCSKRCTRLHENEVKKLVQYKTEVICIIKQ